MYDFAVAQREWTQIPVDDVAYISAHELLRMTDQELGAAVQQAESHRYHGWRNHEGRWRRCLGLDDTHGKTVLDFGCGLGVEALQFARSGNRVILADINRETVDVAARVLRLFGYEPTATCQIVGPHICPPPLGIDVFYANGSLHHTPEAHQILQDAAELLAPGGEVRLMLYTEQGRVIAESEPNYRPHQFFDNVGNYTEAYTPEKLAEYAAPALSVVSWNYLTPDDRYAAAVLRPAR